MKICVVGLGYVGLPLACLFSKKYEVIGFDVSESKINSLKSGVDPTKEVGDLSKCNVDFTLDPKKIREADFIIVSVPTPIDDNKVPDLRFLKSASEIVGKNIKKGSIVVFESTVYPGATEEVCLPIIEKESGLKLNVDFKLGYSPERINPGDKEHTVDRILKVVSGSDKEALDKIAEVYGSVITAGVYKAESIKVAEAAKVIENVQRDLNIALMNELSIIFEKMDIDTKSVLEAAGTKWNFHKYTPGLVGGHCIGVDPYYLTYKAQTLGYEPKVILAGRRINDNMHKQVVYLVEKGLKKKGKDIKGSRILIMGLTFKENVPDFRNSKAKELIKELKSKGALVYGVDPFLSKEIIEDNFKAKFVESADGNYEAVVLFSPHSIFNIDDILGKSPVFVDVKGFVNKKNLSNGVEYFRL